MEEHEERSSAMLMSEAMLSFQTCIVYTTSFSKTASTPYHARMPHGFHGDAVEGTVNDGHFLSGLQQRCIPLPVHPDFLGSIPVHLRYGTQNFLSGFLNNIR
jgi:hypothetical protein